MTFVHFDIRGHRVVRHFDHHLRIRVEWKVKNLENCNISSLSIIFNCNNCIITSYLNIKTQLTTNNKFVASQSFLSSDSVISTSWREKATNCRMWPVRSLVTVRVPAQGAETTLRQRWRTKVSLGGDAQIAYCYMPTAGFNSRSVERASYPVERRFIKIPSKYRGKSDACGTARRGEVTQRSRILDRYDDVSRVGS